MLVFLFAFNTSAYANKVIDSFNFKDLKRINELAILNNVEIKKINNESFLIIENGEKTIVESKMKDGLVYTYYKDINNNIIDFTIFNPETKETYLDDIQSIVYPNYDNGIIEKDNIVIIDNISEDNFVKSNGTFKIQNQAVEEIIKYCPVEGSREIRGNTITYSSVLQVAGRVITVVAFIKAFGAIMGIIVLDQASTLKEMANATIGMITEFGSSSPLLSQHGVKVTTIFVCTKFYYYFYTQDWRVEGLPRYNFF